MASFCKRRVKSVAGGFKTALAWWCLEGRLDPRGIIDLAVDAGYDGIEMAPRNQWPAVADAGLAIVSTQAHASIPDGLNRRENHDRIEREINEKLALAREWRLPVLICFSGNRAGLDDRTGAENTIIGLRRVAAAAEDAGVTLILELLNSRVDHADYQCDRTEWGIEVVEAVNSPRVKLLYDIYHMQIMEGDPIRTIRRHSQHFAHYHVAGNPGRHEPDATQELNYPPIYAAIRETGYDGFVGMEFIPAGDPAAAVTAALAQTKEA